MQKRAALSRTRFLLGEEGGEILHKAKVAVFGLGGVGGFAVEAMARSGVGSFLLVDSDTVSETNLNRQIIATRKTIGQSKVEAMRDRIYSIFPETKVEIRQCFYLPETSGEIDLTGCSYVVDAMDTVTAKLCLIQEAEKKGIPVISCMGAGNKLDPTKFRVADIYETSICPLARIMRKEAKKRGIKSFKVVYSTEDSCHAKVDMGEKEEKAPEGRRALPGSVSFVPSVAGLIMAGEVIRDLAGVK